MHSEFPSSVVFRKYNLPVSFPVLGFLGTHWIPPQTQIPFLHFHNCIEVGICHNAPASLIIENTVYTIPVNGLCLIPAYTPHMIVNAGTSASTMEYVMFDPVLLYSSVQDKGSDFFNRLLFSCKQFSPVLSFEEHPALVTIFSELTQTLQKEAPYYELNVRGSLLYFLIEFMRLIPAKAVLEGTKKQEILPILPAIRYIQSHFSEKLSISCLADICGFSPTHFRRLFQSYVHMQPLEYINHVRINEACSLLTTTDLPIQDIAYQTGFITLSTFNRTFFNILHAKPTHWKRQALLSREHHHLENKESLSHSPFIFL